MNMTDKEFAAYEAEVARLRKQRQIREEDADPFSVAAALRRLDAKADKAFARAKVKQAQRRADPTAKAPEAETGIKVPVMPRAPKVAKATAKAAPKAPKPPVEPKATPVAKATPKAPEAPKPVAEPPACVNNTSAARHDWLERANVMVRDYLATFGADVSAPVRITIGFAWKSRTALGQCWQPEASSDQHSEILIAPTMADPVQILGVILHELIHAATPGARHGRPFAKLAKAAGLEGKMTATVVGAALAITLGEMVKALGPYPAGTITTAALAARPKQTTRYHKATCPECGYVCRVAKAWVEQVGPPHCPAHGAMDVALPGE